MLPRTVYQKRGAFPAVGLVRPALLLVTAALTLPARAQPAPAPPAAVAPPDQPEASPSDPASRPVGVFGAIGYDRGFSNTVEVRFDDGSTQRLASNGGLTLALGVGFLRVLNGRLETRATVGLKYDSIQARNGSVSYLAFPLEVVELYDLAPLRLGAGLSLALAPRLKGTGLARGLAIDFDPSLGILLQAEYVWRLGPSRTVVLGPRFLLQKLRAKVNGVVESTNALGLQIGMTL